MLTFFNVCSQDKKVFSERKTSNNYLVLGIEYAELAQNNFSNIGRNNITFLVGAELGGMQNLKKCGVRYMMVDVELSTDHIQNENQVAFIEGNRKDLVGNIHAQRLSIDYRPYELGIGFIGKWKRHVLTLTPVVYGGLGYNEWYFKNTLFQEDYHLKALTLGGGFRLKSTILDCVFIENPLFDLFTYLVKNRSVAGEIGDTKLTRPAYFGMFSWATIGIQFPV